MSEWVPTSSRRLEVVVYKYYRRRPEEGPASVRTHPPNSPPLIVILRGDRSIRLSVSAALQWLVITSMHDYYTDGDWCSICSCRHGLCVCFVPPEIYQGIKSIGSTGRQQFPAGRRDRCEGWAARGATRVVFAPVLLHGAWLSENGSNKGQHVHMNHFYQQRSFSPE